MMLRNNHSNLSSCEKSSSLLPLSSSTFLLALLLLLDEVTGQVDHQQNQYLDRFTYNDVTIDRGGDDDNGYYKDYSPSEWNLIDCDEQNALGQCIAYRDKWFEGRGWKIEQNYCKHCPHPKGNGPGNCGRHHQSPTILDRSVAIVNNTNYNVCIDGHWMKYEDGFCTLEQLEDQQAFTIERHALRVSNPVIIDPTHENEVRSGCIIEGKGRRFGRIDYAKGFSQWWFLSHIDFHVPSEHAFKIPEPQFTESTTNTNNADTTNGYKKYDAEIQLHHWYSVNATIAGTDNELGTVAIMMEVYDDAPPYLFLDKVICQWRQMEYDTRQECGLDPIPSTYPGCFPLTKRERELKRMKKKKETNGGKTRNLQKKKGGERRLQDVTKTALRTIQDTIIYNANLPLDSPDRLKIHVDETNFQPFDKEEKDWDIFIQTQSDLMQLHDQAYQRAQNKDTFLFNHTAETEDIEDPDRRRRLIEAAELEWFNYFPMLGVRTEYYFRYSGSQTIPPCYGNFVEQSRKGTLHWRVMKDPIRIHKRQLAELKRLLRERIAPPTDPVNPCRPDTAVKVDTQTGDVNGARPLQYFHSAHFKVFCECVNWPSKWPEDRDWCEITNQQERFFDHPYNFHTDGY